VPIREENTVRGDRGTPEETGIHRASNEISLATCPGERFMKKERIVQFGDPVLREIAQPVQVFHKKLHAVIDAIQYTLKHEDGGAALAANQVSILRRIVVIDYCGEYLELINPEILGSSGESVEEEGCLSLPGYFGRVKRAEQIKVRFQDRAGVERIIERGGAMARCIQHETDHLNGVLFIDRMDEQYVSNGKENIAVEDLLNLTKKSQTSM
jgi:peptide deformylase